MIIEEEEIKKNLFSLFYMKDKLLTKSGFDQKVIAETDDFSINESYSSKSIRINVN